MRLVNILFCILICKINFISRYSSCINSSAYDSNGSALKYIKFILVFPVSRKLSPGISRTEVFYSANRTADDVAPDELHAEKWIFIIEYIYYWY